MEIITGLGWLAAAYMGTLALPGATLNSFNDEFAYKVDHNQSCFTRIGGVHGSYGQPSDYSLDLLCNYRLTSEMVTKDTKVWKLHRN